MDYPRLSDPRVVDPNVRDLPPCQWTLIYGAVSTSWLDPLTQVDHTGDPATFLLVSRGWREPAQVHPRPAFPSSPGIYSRVVKVAHGIRRPNLTRTYFCNAPRDERSPPLDADAATNVLETSLPSIFWKIELLHFFIDTNLPQNAAQLKWVWAGHVFRMPDFFWPKTLQIR